LPHVPFINSNSCVTNDTSSSSNKTYLQQDQQTCLMDHRKLSVFSHFPFLATSD